MSADDSPAATSTHLNGPLPSEPEPPTGDPVIALALSGGGVRAALFSLGVIVSLIETKYHRHVRCIASVSGGSIVNAALAHARRFSEFGTVDDFTPLASSLAKILAQYGTFVLSWRNLRRGVKYLYEFGVRILSAFGIVAVLAFGALSDKLRQDWKVDLPHLLGDLFARIEWVPVVAIAIALSMIVIFYYRGLFQEVIYREVVDAGSADRPKKDQGEGLVTDWGSSLRKDGCDVMHVVVATDLLSGEPIYFSKQFVHCNSYGWSTPQEIRTTEAIYSSAAFPVVFPPKKLNLSRKKLNFAGGKKSGTLPGKIQLADGGVFNNLGTDWFSVLEKEQERQAKGCCKHCGGLEVHLPPAIDPKHLIVVNAGAPSGPVKRLLRGPFVVSRIMSVLYDNTVRPRIEWRESVQRPVIDIMRSPLSLAESLKELDGEAGKRATTFADRLALEWPRELWEDFSRDTSSTPTKLSPAEPRPAARLMLHGYLSGLVLLHARYGAALPERLRGERDFLALVEEKKASTPLSTVESNESDKKSSVAAGAS